MPLQIFDTFTIQSADGGRGNYVPIAKNMFKWRKKMEEVTEDKCAFAFKILPPKSKTC